jgi:hypothetical protein
VLPPIHSKNNSYPKEQFVMSNDLRTTMSKQLASGWQANPAMNLLVNDYAKYHTIFVIAGSFLVLAFTLLSLFFWVKFKKAPTSYKSKWGFAKKTYFCFGISSSIVSLFFALLVVANASNAFSPISGFSYLARSSTTSSESDLGRALNEWVRSRNERIPAIIEQRVHNRIAFQRPKAIVCGFFLVFFVAFSVHLWDSLLRAIRKDELSWTLKQKTTFVSGIVMVNLCLLMVVMVVANTQGAIAPMTMSVLGVGG